MEPKNPQLTKGNLDYFFVLFGLNLQLYNMERTMYTSDDPEEIDWFWETHTHLTQQKSQLIEERIIQKRINHHAKAINSYPYYPE